LQAHFRVLTENADLDLMAEMQLKFRIFLFVTVVLVACFSSGCRGMQIHESEKRIDQLESRVAGLEAKVEMLSRK
jgi:outer membrane murein-binding lipoprotein Lpp